MLLLCLIVIHLFVEESIRGSKVYRKGSQWASVFYEDLDRRLSLLSALQSLLIELMPNTNIVQLL